MTGRWQIEQTPTGPRIIAATEPSVRILTTNPPGEPVLTDWQTRPSWTELTGEPCLTKPPAP